MKKRNSLRLRRALSAFSVLLVLFSQSAPAYANVAATSGSSQAEQENTTETVNQESSEEQVPEPSPVVVDKTKLEQEFKLLEEAIANAQQYRPSTYPSERFAELYDQAKTLLADNEADQVSVTTCAENINILLNGLEFKADKSNLQRLLTKAATFNASDYTPASFKALQTQIQIANGILKN